MTTASAWLLAEAKNIEGRGMFQYDIIGDKPFGVVDGTQRRDVSEALDLLALADTPFINRIGWGPESGGTSIEWISEDLGPGYLHNLSIIGTAHLSFVVTSVNGITASQSMYQVKQGTVLYHYNSENTIHTLAVVTSSPATGGTGTSIKVSILTGGGDWASAWGTIEAQDHLYVIGAFAQEGSVPNDPTPRLREVLSNSFTILRQDVQITGSMRSTDMYAIGREDKHQIMLRLKELQRQRERASLYSMYFAQAAAGVAPLMNGVMGFLSYETGSHIDNSTKGLTEDAVNNMVSFIWENGGRNLTFFGHISQTSKFTQWDKNRIRMRINERKGGGLITSYLSESGIAVDIIPMGNVPKNLAFVLDTSKIKLRAKKGRKAIMEKLGKMGDFDDWQIISEFALEMKGYNLKQHGMFSRLI